MSRESFFVRFARKWGWRAYAIPVLLVLTVIVVADVIRDVRGEETGMSAATSELPQGPVPEGGYAENLDVGQLPPGGPFTEDSSGVFVPVDLVSDQVGAGEDTIMRYAVEIEDTVDPVRFGGADAFAGMIDATLENYIPALDRGYVPAIATDPTFIEYNAYMNEQINKIIVGEVEVDEWDNILEGWYAAGGEEYVNDMRAYIASVNK